MKIFDTKIFTYNAAIIKDVIDMRLVGFKHRLVLPLLSSKWQRGNLSTSISHS